MSQNPMDYLWDEVEAYQKLGEEAYNDIINAPTAAVQYIMESLNQNVNGEYPLAQDFMNRAIKNGGDVSFAKDSSISSAIAESHEFKILVSDMASSSIGTVIKFRDNPNLSRSVHDASLSGELDVNDQDYKFTGTLEDTYDFRYDWLPSSWTWKGVVLRLAGNIAKACTDVGLMEPYKVSVELNFEGSK